MKTGRPSVRNKVLAGLPGNINLVAKRAGVSPSSAGKWLGILNAEHVVYISRWLPRKNGPVAFYRLRVKESSVDAPKPQPMTDADYQQRYNERHPGRRSEIRQRYESNLRAKKQRIKTLFAPLLSVSKQYY